MPFKKSSMNEFIKDGLKDQIIQMNNPNCVDCAECCSMGTELTDEEFQGLSKFLKKDKYGKFLYEYGVRIVWTYYKKGTIYWLCPFSYNKRCRIYSKRPAICRNFHCDKDPQGLKEFRDSYPKGSHTIADLFRKDTFDLMKKLRQG